jgi:2-oxoisovalerate dehydrogenase E1 component
MASSTSSSEAPSPSLPPPARLSSRNRDLLLGLYEKMVLLRQSELAAQTAYKKGEMPGFIHLYIGQEAVAAGVCAHLRDDDWITSTHRGHGHALAKGMTVKSLLAELYAKATGCCAGRGGSMHLYDREHGVFGTNGIVGAGIPHAVGAAISAKTRGTDSIAAAFFGDGAINHGAFHESLNFAGARKAGVLFICENNLYATATPLVKVTRNPEIAGKAAAYGIDGISVDGNDVLAVWDACAEAVARARRGEGPTLIEAKTYRTVGHHEGDPLVGTYRNQEELDLWKLRCPILNFRNRLTGELGESVVGELDAIDAKVRAEVDEALEFARKSPEPDPATFARHTWSDEINPPSLPVTPGATAVQGWLDAVRDGIAQEMRRDPHILYFGEGIGERAGSFAHTKGLWTEFGGERVVDTPICELGFTGAAIGASATGCRTIADLMFVDFLFETGGQIPLQASKLRYMSNGVMTCPLVVRAPCGAIKSAGPHHSGTYHSMWAHLPGVIVVMPSNPADAKGLITTALRGNDPVIFLEPKALFASKGEVPQGEYAVPFGLARIARPGISITLVAAGRMVPLTLEAAAALEKEGIQAEVIDLRTIAPLDFETIVTSVTKTGRLLIVDEGYAMCGVGAEIAAAMGEMAFDELDAPVGRLQMEPVSHPFSPLLEAQVLPGVPQIVTAARSVLDGRAPAQRRARTGRTNSAVLSPEAPPSETKASTETVPPAPANEEILAGEAITMPHGDLTVSEAKVVRWLKNAGDAVQQGDGVVEVETDKAVLQIDAPRAGILAQIVAPEGRVIKMGETLGILS